MNKKFGLLTLVILFCLNTSWGADSKQSAETVPKVNQVEILDDINQQDYPPNWPWRGIDIHSCCGGAGPEDIALLADMNVNAVMLNLRVRFQCKVKKISPQLSWSRNIAWADRMLDSCKKNGIIGSIRLNGIPIDPAYGLTEKSPEFWSSPEKYNEAVTLASRLAEHFKFRGPELGSYIILSEPSEKKKVGKRPVIWPMLQQKIIKAIREHDKNRYIVVTPGPGGMPTGYLTSSFLPIADQKIIYGAHMYIPHSFTHQGVHGRSEGYTYPGKIGLEKVDKNFLKRKLVPLRSFQQKHNALVWIGEFSAVNSANGA